VFDYWCVIHVDDDIFSTLYVLSHDMNDDDILHYFLSPTYKADVTMRSGDILLFNPALQHWKLIQENLVFMS
jgi:hypothetical protein